MQIRELRVFLLILLVWGCGPGRMSEVSDYIKENKGFKNKGQLAFLLNTRSDSLNQLFGILAESLVDTELVRSPHTLRELERAAAMSRGRWLMTRARTAEAGGGIGRQFDLDERFRWGYAGYEAALDYGMTSPDSLKLLEQECLTSLSRLHAEYVGSSPEIMEAGVSADSVTEIAGAQIRYAALMNFGAEISAARRESEVETTFRTDANRAQRAGRNLFREAGRRFRDAEARKPQRKLTDFLDTTSRVDEAENVRFELQPPDTEAYVRAGVFYGFELIAANPAEVVRDIDLLNGLAWLRWNEYRMRSDVKLVETPLLDSVYALLTDGPQPGYLTERPDVPGPVSPLGMYELVTQLSELYLGIEPHLYDHKVMVQPRLPASWGHTVARVPLGEGFFHVDYDFEKLSAEVWTENVTDSLSVEFGFPYRTGGWLTTQFAITKEDNRKLIKGEMDGTRLHLLVE